MTSLSSRNRGLPTALRHNAAILLSYLALSAVTHPMSVVANDAQVLFSAAGVALGALLLFGFEILPAVALGAFIAGLWSGGPAAGLILSAATVLGPTCGYVLISKLGTSKNQLRTLPQLGAPGRTVLDIWLEFTSRTSTSCPCSRSTSRKPSRRSVE